MAPSGKDLHTIIDQIQAKQVGFRCLQQGAVEKTTSIRRLVLGILGAVAEFETDILKQRPGEGIEKAKKRGVYKGRPASIDAGRIAELKSVDFGASAIASLL